MDSVKPTYKEELTAAMDELAQDRRTRFIGYGLQTGRAMGTLKHVHESQIIETPVAENLMVGMAIGIALKGFRPVVFLERCDFMMNAMDAIVNHLDKITTISRGQFNPTAILRIVVGNKNKPLFTGKTHTQDLSDGLQDMVRFPVRKLEHAAVVRSEYQEAIRRLPFHSTALVEYKDLI